MSQEPPADADDPIDLLVKSVPRHLWITIISVTIMLTVSWLFFKPPEFAEETDASSTTLEGRIVEVLSEETLVIAGQEQPVQRVVVEITRGSQQGQRVEILNGREVVLTEGSRVKKGDRVLLEYDSESDDAPYYLTDFVRWPALLSLTLVFVIAAVAVGRGVGLRAVVSMGLSVVAIGGFIIPGIMAGNNPLVVCTVGSLLLMTASLYLVYGWTWKTHASLAGLSVSVLATALLAVIFADLGHLAGFGSEEAVFLAHLGQMQLNLHGVLLGSIVIGAVGVLDDVTVGQASATFELHRADPQLRGMQLFRRSMIIGRDHIASMTNTLLLAYVGASLPLFLLMASLNAPLGQSLNREFIAQEIVTTLVGSLGLILAVPVTSLVASWLAQRDDPAAPA